MRINKITIRGNKQERSPVPAMEAHITLQASYNISGGVRGISEQHTIDLKDNHLVELVFEDDTTWLCSPDSLEEIFPEAAAAVSRSATGSFEIPVTLQSDSLERGLIGNILLKALNVFTKKKVTQEIKKIAAALEKKQLDNQSGLYRLDSGFLLRDMADEKADRPYLLFLHGTASSTRSSFGELLETELWRHIQSVYGNHVLAFQHESLTKSPLQNALELVQQLPQDAVLHMISHSRGGLIGDILARFCSSQENHTGFNADEISYLKNKCNRLADIDMLGRIKKAVQQKKIRIEKFIRVACPAAGTILASKRLDNFLNISFNLIGYGTGLGANPAYTAFRNLIAAAVDTKNDANVLPGLEAMDPDSPFIKVLNNPDTDILIDSPLTIISGNCKARINLKALLIIASKLFYQQDNDLVVNTDSMYMGSKRETEAQYFFDEATNVDHFHYFKNPLTNNAILQALQASGTARIDGFSTLQERLAAEQRGLEGGQVFTDWVSGKKPIVVLLPGIMGSSLAKNGKLLWINYLKFLAGDLQYLEMGTQGIGAPSLIRTSYSDLVVYLSEAYDVVTFPFDWRLPLTESAVLFDTKITALLKYKQPIKVIGHSMGGVLVRDFIIQHPKTWQQLNQSPGFRLVFLGSPLGGSFRIPAVLFGQDAIIEKLSKIDLFHTRKDLISMFCKMPGILGLLPLTKENDFAATATWKAMSETPDWPLPSAKDTKAFGNYRTQVLKGMENMDYSNMVYIAGKDKATPCGYRIDQGPAGKELVFLSTGEGDQSVTWDTGIPGKMIEKNLVYYVNVTHGALANDASLFKGMSEILEAGATNLLSRERPVLRAVEKVFRAPKQENMDITPAGLEKTILGLTPQQQPSARTKNTIAVTVSNGDLRYAAYPVMGGHFQGDGIMYAEAAIDRYLGGALSERNKLGIYPGEPGTSELFTAGRPGFPGAIIIGLGLPGSLTAYQLTSSAEQAVTKHLLDLNGNHTNQSAKTGAAVLTGISSLIIGSRYGGLSIENSIQCILQGVHNANNKIRAIYAEKSVLIQQVEFIEQYEDTALNCFYSLNTMVTSHNKTLDLRLTKKIKPLLGSKKQLHSASSAGWWKRLSVTLVENGETTDNDTRCLQFSLSTGGAREEQKQLFSNHPMIEQMMEDLSTNNLWTPKMAKIIFELLIPNHFKDQLKAQSNLNWILEKSTAAYPWELLHDSGAGTMPFCVNAGMIRQLVTTDFRDKIKAATKNNVLVVGDPDLLGSFTQLPGALKEGKTVAALLHAQGYNTTSSLNEASTDIIVKLFQDEYKIVHLAGHGIFNHSSPERSGMLLGSNTYLSAREIEQLSYVPELVFVNCCHLGKTDSAAEMLFRNRYKMAANVGTGLIEIGVKAVVVAGWAVDDAAALEFTRVFYRCMLDGDCFGDAVRKARRWIYDEFPGTNTWGAYQCYGDPFYTLRDATGKKKPRKYDFIIPEQALIELHNLYNALDVSKGPGQDYMDTLSDISEAIARAGIVHAGVIEKEAFIYAELNEYALALEKFESLLNMEKADFSIATLEKYCNIRAKKAVADFLQNSSTRTRGLKQINLAISDLETLLHLSPTAERYSLLGSAYKRKTLLCSSKPEKIKAISEAAFYYQKADEIQGALYKAYAKTNWLEMESILCLAKNRKWGQTIRHRKNSYTLPEAGIVNAQLSRLANALHQSTAPVDYWHMMEIANISLCQAVLHVAGAENGIQWNTILETYQGTWLKAGSKGKKIAEIEHLALLLDGLGLGNAKNIAVLKKQILRLKETLAKMT